MNLKKVGDNRGISVRFASHTVHPPRWWHWGRRESVVSARRNQRKKTEVLPLETKAPEPHWKSDVTINGPSTLPVIEQAVCDGPYHFVFAQIWSSSDWSKPPGWCVPNDPSKQGSDE